MAELRFFLDVNQNFKRDVQKCILLKTGNLKINVQFSINPVINNYFPCFPMHGGEANSDGIDRTGDD